MKQRSSTRCLLMAAGLVGLLACEGAAGPDALPADGPHPLPDLVEGKADNYISSNAREFSLRGIAHAKLPDGFETLAEEARGPAVEREVGRRLSNVTWAIRRHIEQVLRTSNGASSGDDARFFTYFKRNNQQSSSPELLLDEGRVRFSFELELVGSVYLMSQLAPGDSSRRTFEVAVSPWGSEAGERVVVEISGSTSRDAFPQYAAMFADGIYDIGIHFGGDYNEERLDLDTARWTLEYLLESGWTNASVTDFESLSIDSPPFVRSLRVEDREIEARVYLFHSDMVEEADEERLTEVMKTSLSERDVVIYSGHAGAGAGFILDYQPRHEIKANKFAELPLADKYQIYIFDGCQTYRTYTDDILTNPAKTYANVDMVTTVNTTPFAAGYQLIFQFVNWLTLTGQDDSHFPLSWKTILRGLNTERWDDVHYGVHGIDANPRLNPHASEGIACQPCQTDKQCGAGGNLCLGYGAGAACGVACTTDTACGSEYRCARLTDDPNLFYLPKQCVRRDYSCP